MASGGPGTVCYRTYAFSFRDVVRGGANFCESPASFALVVSRGVVVLGGLRVARPGWIYMLVANC